VAICSCETPVLIRATERNIPEDGILHSHRRENLKSYIALTGCALWRTRDVSPVRYELGFYIPEDGILHSHRRERLKSYTAIISLSITDRYSVFRKVRTSDFTQQSHPLPQLTDTVFSVRYEPQILHSNYNPLAQLTDTVFSVRYEPQILHSNHIP
jgi:hypothetical protein